MLNFHRQLFLKSLLYKCSTFVDIYVQFFTDSVAVEQNQQEDMDVEGEEKGGEEAISTDTGSLSNEQGLGDFLAENYRRESRMSLLSLLSNCLFFYFMHNFL
jgi:hypothetical protein